MNSNVQAVIDALACFKTNQHECLKCSYNPHAGMPWPYGCIAGQRNIIDDVIALLKAQEPHIMTLGEWREWKRKPLSQRDPVYYVDNKGLGSWIAPNDQLFIYATPELGYGVLFVCWTSRPTVAQREATPWEG